MTNRYVVIYFITAVSAELTGLTWPVLAVFDTNIQIIKDNYHTTPAHK